MTSDPATTNARSTERGYDHGCDALGGLAAERRVLHERLSSANPGALGGWSLCLICRHRHVEPNLQTLFGFTTDRGANSKSILAALDAPDRALVTRIARSTLRNRKADTFDCEFPVNVDDGARSPRVRAHTRILRNSHGRALYLAGTLRDVTSQRAQERDQARKLDVLRIAMQSLGAGIVTTDVNGNVQWLNPVAEKLLGIDVDASLGRPLARIAPLVDERRGLPLTDVVQQSLRHGRVMGHDGERLITRTGAGRVLESEITPIRDEHGETYGCVVVFHDATEGRTRHRELNYLVAHDELTGLINRREFEHRLRLLFEGRHDASDPHAVLCLDLDRFKPVNDRCGHAAGDNLLRTIAQRLRHAVREEDTVARIGGDEFAVILRHCPEQQGLEIARQLCARIDEFRFRHEGESFTLGVSIGMVLLDGSWHDIDELLRAADAACYRAKQAGRGCVRFGRQIVAATLSPPPQSVPIDWLQGTLDKRPFALYAQRVQRLAGHESHPLRPTSIEEADIVLHLTGADATPSPPGAFLSAAERQQRLPEIDRWMIEQVLTRLGQTRAPVAAGRLWITLADQSLADKGFMAWLLDTLNGLAPSSRKRLGLRMDELFALNHLADAATLCESLQHRGVGVSLNRFGAGASSYGYLRGLPVDCLKIDEQFTRALCSEPLNQAAVRCFTEIASVLGMRTTAEFVQTPHERALLAELGVDSMMGEPAHRATPLDTLFASLDRGVVDTIG